VSKSGECDCCRCGSFGLNRHAFIRKKRNVVRSDVAVASDGQLDNRIVDMSKPVPQERRIALDLHTTRLVAGEPAHQSGSARVHRTPSGDVPQVGVRPRATRQGRGSADLRLLSDQTPRHKATGQRCRPPPPIHPDGAKSQFVTDDHPQPYSSPSRMRSHAEFGVERDTIISLLRRNLPKVGQPYRCTRLGNTCRGLRADSSLTAMEDRASSQRPQALDL
jgi:hypothetical protein